MENAIKSICNMIRFVSIQLGIEFDEVIEWIRAYNNKTAPWEE